METTKFKSFAQFARRYLMGQVSTKLKLVLAENSAARRESTEPIKRLEEAIKNYGKEQIIERVAYIWFNRFCALRFMDVNRYTRIGVVSPTEGQFQPEILAEAKMGHIDEETVPEKTRQQIFNLLNGKAPSCEPQGEAYRLLVVTACNFWNKAMPFLFQLINDYTELLMPDDLLSGNSILAYTREAMTPNVCQEVEVIGWLYQFYISEKKDEVFKDLQKNKKITPENIPAATQLFTPHWIVRYLVENSLGHLWMLNHPNSRLVEQMDYYIRPGQAETDFLPIDKPEEIKACDPACGSGHMLTYTFDLLYAIYEEEGYEPAEIPEKILTHNLYGIEIDARAGALAAFALTMKARDRQRRFFNRGVKPNICVLENIRFDVDELDNYMDFVGSDLFTAPLQTILRQFEEADNFGSLIRPDVTDVAGMLRILEAKNVSGQLFLSASHEKVLQALRQTDYLSPRYHVVIANPPYMGSKGMNGRLGAWAKCNYPNSKSDLFAMFIERNLDLARKRGIVAMITMQSWMFLSSFQTLRARILGQDTLLSMAHLGPRAFDSIGGEVVSTTAFVLENGNKPEYNGGYLRLVNGNTEAEKEKAISEAIKNPGCGWFYRASAAEFKKIPGSPIAYWLSRAFIEVFGKTITLGSIASPRAGLATGDNTIYQRLWHEVAFSDIAFDCSSSSESSSRNEKWYPCNSGGDFRKWFGNNSVIVNWQHDGKGIRNFKNAEGKLKSRPQNTGYFFKPGVTWTKLSSNNFAARLREPGYIFDDTGRSAFPIKDGQIVPLLGFMCSSFANLALRILNPSMSFTSGDIANLPVLRDCLDIENTAASGAVELGRQDWNSYEASWDFTNLPLLHPNYLQPTLEATYQKLGAHWQEMTLKIRRLEEENNRIFIEAYGLQDELMPEVPLNEITLTCNPHYRYGGDKSDEELEELLLADTIRELISYAVGCMFGRYALEKPGPILANQGETTKDYLKQVPEPTFPADEDNVIPMLDGDWFTDDIAERFRKFLHVAFGEEHYEANLKFVEKALGKNGKARDIRVYFLKEFYSDHVKRYKKRPIYWLFSSPRGSFNALIYIHRYRPDTVSVVLNDYLREFRTKLTSHKNHLDAVSISASASQGEKTKALKEINKISKMIVEMEEYERDILYPLATKQVEIDLDDGVKVNYPKLGAALKKIPGLSA